MARDGRPDLPAGRSMSSITFRPMRSVDLGSADGPAERALDHHQRALAEERGDLLEELVDVGRAEVLELRRTDLRIDPVPGLAWPGLAGHGLHRVLVSLDGGEPVIDALLDGVGGRGGGDLGLYGFRSSWGGRAAAASGKPRRPDSGATAWRVVMCVSREAKGRPSPTPPGFRATRSVSSDSMAGNPPGFVPRCLRKMPRPGRADEPVLSLIHI